MAPDQRETARLEPRLENMGPRINGTRTKAEPVMAFEPPALPYVTALISRCGSTHHAVGAAIVRSRTRRWWTSGGSSAGLSMGNTPIASSGGRQPQAPTAHIAPPSAVVPISLLSVPEGRDLPRPVRIPMIILEKIGSCPGAFPLGCRGPST